MNCATTNRATFANGLPFEGVPVCSNAIHGIACEKVECWRKQPLISTGFTVGAMNCATTNRATFVNGLPFEWVPVCSDAIHGIACEKVECWRKRPLISTGFTRGAMNCATTNRATFANGLPFEWVPVCSDAIHGIACEKVECWRKQPLISTGFTVGAMNCATTNCATFANGPPFEWVPVCSDAIHRIDIALLRTVLLLRTASLLNGCRFVVMRFIASILRYYEPCYFCERPPF